MFSLNLEEYIRSGLEARQRIDVAEVEQLAKKLAESISSGGKLIAFGNGGSAADSQHFVAELSGRFMKERGSLPAIALTTNTSALTAIGNDYSFDQVFSRQVSSLAGRNDFVVGISTSGNSPNVVEAIKTAKTRGAFTVAMTGSSGGKLLGIADHTFRVASDLTPIIQEVHIAAIHMICMKLDEILSGK